jgi:hypothetical protein
MSRKIFIILSIIFAVMLLFFVILSRPTDIGPRLIPFALPFSICAAGFAIASSLIKK